MAKGPEGLALRDKSERGIPTTSRLTVQAGEPAPFTPQFRDQMARAAGII